MKRLLWVSMVVFFTLPVLAQVPQKMSYQAVIRNNNNSLISVRPVGMRISIVKGSQNGTVVYSESQNATTNINGLVSLQIGTGTLIYGSFALIDWAEGPYFIRLETDPDGGINYSITGTSELLSVPYALFTPNKSKNDYSGTSKDLINLASLILENDVILHITPGLSFTSAGNVLVSYNPENHFHGTIMLYNKITGLLTLHVTEIVGMGSFNSWTIVIDGAKGEQGVQGPKGRDGLNGIDGINGSIGPMGVPGVNGIDGKNGIDGERGPIGLTGATGSFNGTFAGDVTGNQAATVVEKINGISLSSLESGILKNTKMTGIPSIAIAGDFPTLNQNTTGTASNITGIVLPVNGGTGIANNNASSLSLPGAFATTITTTGLTSIVLPTTGTLYGTANASITSAQLINSLTDATGTGSSVFSISPVLTGIPFAPTAPVGTNTAQLATTSFVLANTGGYQSITAGEEVSTESITDVMITGMTLSPPAGKYLVSFNSQYTIAVANRTGQAKIDLRSAYNLLMAKTVTNASHVNSYGGGETLTSGVYTNSGACTAAGTLILDAQNNSNAEFVFRLGGTFNIAAGTTIFLINGASACNVYWISEAATSVGASSNIKGAIISNNGSITVNNNSVIEGRLYSNAGANTLIGSTIAIPAGCASIFGSVSGFAIFTSMGNVTNMGYSIVTGDIGTNSGTISGFGSSTVYGTLYPPSVVPSSTTAVFSIYQNGTVIPFSQRSRISTLNLGEISLQGIATVAEGETIDIRWKIDAGTVKLQNRILTLVNVR
jgi:hypothetical protein